MSLRVHDMGGRLGDGPVRPDPEDAPVFAEDWHGRALAVTLAAGALGQWTLDTSRHARERLSPKDYSRFSYYEKWIAGLADLLVENGVLTRKELMGELGGTEPHPLAGRMMKADAVAGALARGGPSARDVETDPRFGPGDMVRALRPTGNRMVPGGHTRLPSYAAGARGRILRHHGGHVLPDANAHGRGECPDHLYAVAFPASELWADPENPADEVILDLWQCYLEPA